MPADKILAFSDYLARPPQSFSEIAKFLAMNTFSNESFLALTIEKLTTTGTVCVIGGFGWTDVEYKSLADIPIQAKLPLTDSIRENKVITFQNDAALIEKFPFIVTGFTTPVEWQFGVAIPIYPIGGMVLYSKHEIVLNYSTEIFCIAIGSLLGLYASLISTTLIEVEIDGKKERGHTQGPLSDRQFVITELLERGFNNAQIAQEIGYSESLIRQETVAIYRKLQVSGRKALQGIQKLDPEPAAN